MVRVAIIEIEKITFCVNSRCLFVRYLQLLKQQFIGHLVQIVCLRDP